MKSVTVTSFSYDTVAECCTRQVTSLAIVCFSKTCPTVYRARYFLPRDALYAAQYCYRKSSVRSSLCLSVTLMLRGRMRWVSLKVLQLAITISN